MEEKVTQGVQGTVLWFEGNLMPSPGTPAPKGKPIVREIVFCKPLKMKEVQQKGSFYVALDTHIIKKVTSDDKGIFKIQLPEGKYSVFTKEEDSYYANLFDGQGYIQLVTVKANELTSLDIRVDYKATY
ncbi:MAG: carboxypeptidase regulatory-like domain-containing protein [Flammeovirgaceae bacterium]